MSQQVVTMYAQQYANTIQLLLQQKGSRLSGAVTTHPITGAKQATVVEQIGAVAAKKRVGRYPPLQPADTPHDRPWVFPSDYDWNDLIDNADKLRTVADPQGSYAQNGMYAMGRSKDDEILGAFFADRVTGENASTTVTWATEGQTVANNFGAAGAVGLTVAKLREAKRQLMAAEVDEDEAKYIAVKAKQHDNLLGEIQVISLDFNDRPVLVKGKVVEFLGFQLIHTERIIANATPNDRVPAWVKSGMHLGMWNDITSDISQRKDLAGLPWQVYVYGTFGATRSEGKKFSEIICA